jgi:amino acid transporter
MKNEVFLESPVADESQGGTQIVDGVISLDRESQLQRGLKSRHIQFLALGGA